MKHDPRGRRRNRQAWVEPGVVNAHLCSAVAKHGLHYAPDPSSQNACTIGGNVAENSGGPHTLKYGVTTNHILALEVVLPDGTRRRAGRRGRGHARLRPGRGLRRAPRGPSASSTKILVRLTPLPEGVKTCWPSSTPSATPAAASPRSSPRGIMPAAIEMIDQITLRAVEAYIHAGLPARRRRGAAGRGRRPRDDLDAAGRRRDGGAAGRRRSRDVRLAKDDAERAKLWKGRKQAFGALGRLAPNYYTHDGVIPRTKLPEVLDEISRIAERNRVLIANVFHAGDGNLHPVVLYDEREAGVIDRVRAAGDEILQLWCIGVGGALSGEHGIGLEKIAYMGALYRRGGSRGDAAPARTSSTRGALQPGQGDPGARPLRGAGRGARAQAADRTLMQPLPPRPRDPGHARALAELVRTCAAEGRALFCEGSGSKRHHGPAVVAGARPVSMRDLSRVTAYDPLDMVVSVQPGSACRICSDSWRPSGQWLPSNPPYAEATIGGILATASAGPRRLGYGTMKDYLLGMRVVGAAGRRHEVGRAGREERTGYDLHKLHVGAFGSLGVLLEAHFKVVPRPAARRACWPWRSPSRRTRSGSCSRRTARGCGRWRSSARRPRGRVLRRRCPRPPTGRGAGAGRASSGSRAAFDRHLAELATCAPGRLEAWPLLAGAAAPSGSGPRSATAPRAGDRSSSAWGPGRTLCPSCSRGFGLRGRRRCSRHRQRPRPHRRCRPTASSPARSRGWHQQAAARGRLRRGRVGAAGARGAGRPSLGHAGAHAGRDASSRPGIRSGFFNPGRLAP